MRISITPQARATSDNADQHSHADSTTAQRAPPRSRKWRRRPARRHAPAEGAHHGHGSLLATGWQPAGHRPWQPAGYVRTQAARAMGGSCQLREEQRRTTTGDNRAAALHHKTTPRTQRQAGKAEATQQRPGTARRSCAATRRTARPAMVPRGRAQCGDTVQTAPKPATMSTQHCVHPNNQHSHTRASG